MSIQMDIMKKFVAEMIGTFWLVFAGCGSALLAAGFMTSDSVHIGIGFVGVSLAFGLTVVSMAYGIGHISGAHLNPAVTLGLFLGGRVHVKDVVPYILAQAIGGVVAAFVLFAICSGAPEYDASTYAGVCNGFAEHSPGSYSMMAAFLCEAVLTFIFLIVILGSTDWRAPAGFAGLAIGLCLTLIHLFAIPVTNCSVNPARSLGPAIVAMTNGQSWPLQQLWLFIAAPAAGAALAGVVYRSVFHAANPADNS
jgi:aquaporin Z